MMTPDQEPVDRETVEQADRFRAQIFEWVRTGDPEACKLADAMEAVYRHDLTSGRLPPGELAQFEQQFVDDLAAITGPKTPEMPLGEQVKQAISTLGALKQEVINRRFGFAGPRQSHEEIAQALSSSLSPELREEIALERGIALHEVTISPEDVEDLEKEALRDLMGYGNKK